MSATLTSLPAVTVVSALVPVFLPTLTLVTPLTPLSAACTFLEHPDAHRNPVTAKTVVFSSAATTSAWVVVVVTTGAATAPAVKAAKAAIIVIVVFMFSLVARMLNYPRQPALKHIYPACPVFFSDPEQCLSLPWRRGIVDYQENLFTKCSPRQF